MKEWQQEEALLFEEVFNIAQEEVTVHKMEVENGIEIYTFFSGDFSPENDRAGTQCRFLHTVIVVQHPTKALRLYRPWWTSAGNETGGRYWHHWQHSFETESR